MLAAGLGFLAAFAIIFSGIPIAIALALVGFLGFAALNGVTPALSMIALAAKDSTMSYSLSVIPLFILMGNFIAGAGISGDLYRAAQVFIGRRRGGLAMATILSCGGFAAVCGSSVATAVTMAKVSLPSMRKYGYSDGLATASVAAGGTLGILIPPSVLLVIYGIITESHIGKLFAAGIIPGLLGIFGYLMAVQWTAWRDPSAAPPGAIADRAEKIDAVRSVWPVVLLFGLVIGGIYGGWFTATEAAGIGASGGFFFALLRGRLSLATLYEILLDTVQTTAVMFALLLGAMMFGEFINYTGAHEGLLQVVEAKGLPPALVITFIIIIYLVLGCLLESISMMLLTVPLFFPIITGLGYDPIWFGIMVVVLVEIGLITPPIGVNLFVIKAVSKDVSMMTIIRGIIPFIVADLFRILILALVPAISLWLPNLLFN
ncbi:tripartite ATP-independent transporter DctM subunit [Rhodoligotrophos appendicifer]|uniref:TRAP transporter large permease n=1 Tax=Rhodoligotrophos appendicifer TaxID=987056 RepID=UPI00117E76AB|nr:TRAP transporter large permease [Rhodoligotrophos appendicifer]